VTAGDRPAHHWEKPSLYPSGKKGGREFCSFACFRKSSVLALADADMMPVGGLEKREVWIAVEAC
jgi:hypothetical protein